MALQSLALSRQGGCKFFKVFNPCSLSSLIFSKIPYCISTTTTETHGPISPESLYDSSFPSGNSRIVDNLISIFTKRPFNPDCPELKQLASIIDSEVVESVLKGIKSWKVAQIFFNWASRQNGYNHNCYTYNAMASILSRTQQRDTLRVMIKDILNSRCSFTPGALGFFIRCLGNVGLVEEANQLFDGIRLKGLCIPNSYSYNCLLEAMSKSGSIDMMEKRLKEMSILGWEHDKYTLTPVMHAFCKSGKCEEALNVFNQMYDRGWVDAHIYSMLALSFSKWGEVDKAYELVKRMDDQDIRLNEKTFCVLIHGFVKESCVDKALNLFDKMRKSGFAPDISVYDALIGGLCKNKEFDKALCLFKEMKEFGIQPDVGIFTKLLSSFSDESRIIKLLEEIPEDEDDTTIILFYNAVLNVYISNGLMDEAYHLIQKMMGNESSYGTRMNTFSRFKRMIFPNITSYSIVIDGLLKNGRLDHALSLFIDMQRIACRPNILLYNNLINELCNSDRLEESFMFLKEMKESGLEPTHFTHNSIYGCLCQRKDVLGAINMLREMRAYGHEPWIKYSTLLVKELCTQGRAVEACDFLSDMVQEGFLPDIISYSAAIGGLIKIRELDRALNLFKDLCSRGFCPDVVAFNILIGGLCKANRLTEAEKLMDEIVMRGLSPSVVTYNQLIDCWCKNGSIDKAMLLLSKMSRDDREPNVITYTTLMDGFCREGRPDDALAMWNEMDRKGCAANKIAFMALIHGLCKCCRPTSAIYYLHEMEKREMKADSFVYISLLSAFLSDLNFPLAFEILKKMVDKGFFPEPHDKNYLVVRDAILKLCMDDRTSSGIQNLMEEGKIPTSCLSTL